MAADWLRAMEREVRRFGGDLPVDAFLPELRAGHLEAGSRIGEGDATAIEPPEPERSLPDPGVMTAKTREADAPPSPQDIEAEIREFMNRDRRGLAADDAIDDFLGTGIDPNVD
jgi:hypothetical protein